MVKKVILGETMPVQVLKVEEIPEKKKYLTTIRDDEGDVSTLYLDVPLPLGNAELRIIHIDQKSE